MIAPAPALVMVAPNGARRTKADHPALPMTIEETARTAALCHEAGAGAVHAHLRDPNGAHVLDAEAYSELIAGIGKEAGPDLVVQITTEAVGRYRPEEQRAVIDSVRPEAASVALSEMIPDASHESEAAAFYARCFERDIAIQHILYEPAELDRMADLIARGILPCPQPSVLFVLGRYVANQQSDPRELLGFIAAVPELERIFMVCAFGRSEIPALASAIAFGGHARVGFENALTGPDGTPWQDNVAAVSAIVTIAENLGARRPDRQEALYTLGRRK